MSETDLSQVTAVILSGGAGSRFNRLDKGWVEWQDKALIEHCIDSLQPQVARIVVSCNRHHEKYKQLGHTLCQDKRPVFQGPLAGIEAGLDACDTPYALLYPCDSAGAPEDLVETLLTELIAQDADIAYLNRFGTPQYLIAVVRCNLQQSVANYLDEGGRAVRRWYEEHNAIAVNADYPEQQIININTPDELH